MRVSAMAGTENAITMAANINMNRDIGFLLIFIRRLLLSMR